MQKTVDPKFAIVCIVGASMIAGIFFLLGHAYGQEHALSFATTSEKMEFSRRAKITFEDWLCAEKAKSCKPGSEQK